MRIHAAPVIAPARIQEINPGELFIVLVLCQGVSVYQGFGSASDNLGIFFGQFLDIVQRVLFSWAVQLFAYYNAEGLSVEADLRSSVQFSEVPAVPSRSS